jgi:hypothetical protein
LSSPKHTPGPLEVGFYRPTERFLMAKEHVAVMRPDGSLVAVTGPSQGADADVSRADARLFAIAAEMFDQLRFLDDMARPCDTCSGTGRDPTFPENAEEACKTCGGVGETLEAEGELGCIRKLIAKIEEVPVESPSPAMPVDPWSDPRGQEIRRRAADAFEIYSKARTRVRRCKRKESREAALVAMREAEVAYSKASAERDAYYAAFVKAEARS